MHPAGSFGSAAFLWPALVAAEAGRLTSLFAQSVTGLLAPAEGGRMEQGPRWSTPNRIALDLPSMQLRDFSRNMRGVATLICAPFALHRATIADFARHHSLVEALRAAGIHRLHLTDWRSASPEMRFLSIDSLLADLNVAVDYLGGAVDLIGICQGGWMSLAYAARFPAKVRRLVIAGAPVDLAAGESRLSTAAKAAPLSLFEDLVALGDGRLLGQRMLELWGSAHLDSASIRQILQCPGDEQARLGKAREARFRAWYATTVDLPGTYYLQVVEWLFKDTSDIREALVPGSHLTLFMGRTTLARTWPRIARWLLSDRRHGSRSAHARRT